MNFYVSLFPGSSVEEIIRYEEGENKGKILQANFTLGGNKFICIDTVAKHNFRFTPVISVFVDCESMGELERVYAALAEGGEALMPLGEYGFSQKFGWLKDRYGFLLAVEPAKRLGFPYHQLLTVVPGINKGTRFPVAGGKSGSLRRVD